MPLLVRSLFLFYKAVSKKSYEYMTASGITFGLALSCKYPAALGVLIALIWLLILVLKGELSFGLKTKRQTLFSISLVAFIPVIILTFVLLWGWWIIPHGLDRTVIHSINRHRMMGHIPDGRGTLGLQGFTPFYLEVIFKYFSFVFLQWPFLQWPLLRIQSPEPLFALLGFAFLTLKIVKRKATGLEGLLMLYFLIPLISLSILRFKLTHYILIVWPPLTLISTLGLYKTLQLLFPSLCEP